MFILLCVPVVPNAVEPEIEVFFAVPIGVVMVVLVRVNSSL